MVALFLTQTIVGIFFIVILGYRLSKARKAARAYEDTMYVLLVKYEGWKWDERFQLSMPIPPPPWDRVPNDGTPVPFLEY